jgi:uncharacterized membrane protein YccC
MWGAVFRQVFAYLLTRRGKRALAFAGMMLLCFVTALLLDTKLYISASFIGFLAAVLLMMWLAQYWRVRQQDRERQGRRLEAAERRHAAAQVRGEKLDKAKAAVADGARAVGEATASSVGAAKTKITNIRAGLRFWPRRERAEGE